jgi:hypothetical protein
VNNFFKVPGFPIRLKGYNRVKTKRMRKPGLYLVEGGFSRSSGSIPEEQGQSRRLRLPDFRSSPFGLRYGFGYVPQPL